MNAESRMKLVTVIFSLAEDQLPGGEFWAVPDHRYSDSAYWHVAEQKLHDIQVQEQLLESFGAQQAGPQFLSLRLWFYRLMEALWAQKPLTPQIMFQTLEDNWALL